MTDEQDSLLSASFRPGRNDAVHARIGDRLAHVLVVVNEETQEHAIRRCCPPEERHVLLPVRLGIAGTDCIERAFHEIDDLRLVGDRLLRNRWQRRPIERALDACLPQQEVIPERDVHVDFADRPDARLWSPGELLGRCGFCHARILIDDVGVRIEDLGSKNGTTVGDAPVTPMLTLQDGDRIGFGPVVGVYRSSSGGFSTETVSRAISPPRRQRASTYEQPAEIA